MYTLFSRLGLPQRLAIVCGSLCLLVSLALATVGSLSSHYLLEKQYRSNAQALVARLAANIAPTLGQSDLISLEVTLRQLANSYQLDRLEVLDVEARQISAAGSSTSAQAMQFRAPVVINGHIAGELVMLLQPDMALLEQRRMSLGLFLLAVLLSLFVAALTASWGQQIAIRLRTAIDRLRIDDSPENSTGREELALLEERISQLPLELLKTSATAPESIAEYQAAGFLYVRLNSLSRYVETLDELSLLRFTEMQRKLVAHAAELYQGELVVARQFGLLVSFSGTHRSGSPAWRAASTAWLIREVASSLQQQLRFQLSVSLAVAISEAGTGSNTDIYPGLYGQHIIDELAELTATEDQRILLGQGAAEDEDLSARAEIASAQETVPVLEGFEETWRDLLQRQQLLLTQQLG